MAGGKGKFRGLCYDRGQPLNRIIRPHPRHKIFEQNIVYEKGGQQGAGAYDSHLSGSLWNQQQDRGYDPQNTGVSKAGNYFHNGIQKRIPDHVLDKQKNISVQTK